MKGVGSLKSDSNTSIGPRGAGKQTHGPMDGPKLKLYLKEKYDNKVYLYDTYYFNAPLIVNNLRKCQPNNKSFACKKALGKK